MTLSIFPCLVLLVGSCSGFIFGSNVHPWDGLKVTWGINPFNSINFADMPRTEAEAEQSGFTIISGCEHENFLGKRYMKDNDPAVILIYDVNGYIAGIQAGIPTTLSNGYPSLELQKHPFVRDFDKHYITAYFVSPDLICTRGRTSSEVSTQCTGTDLYIQNSTNPMESIKIPHQEADIGSTKWVKGHCFPAMGVHYWYDISLDMSCDQLFPVFLLYNGGVLNAFGWAFKAELPSPRYEHLSQSTFKNVTFKPGMFPNYFTNKYEQFSRFDLMPYREHSGKAFMQVKPSCLDQSGTLSTLHIYLNGRPQTDFLCD